jgi:hypothetical protein
MAHFAEIDENNKVLRVLVACNDDIANNGGEQSAEAAKHFESTVPLSTLGVKWVQTSYNNNFRKHFAGRDYTYDETKDKFITPKPYPSWTLDANDDWVSPVGAAPALTAEQEADTANTYQYEWNETDQQWDLITTNFG